MLCVCLIGVRRCVGDRGSPRSSLRSGVASEGVEAQRLRAGEQETPEGGAGADEPISSAGYDQESPISRAGGEERALKNASRWLR